VPITDETKVVRIDVELVLGNFLSFLSSLDVSLFSLFTVKLFDGTICSDVSLTCISLEFVFSLYSGKTLTVGGKIKSPLLSDGVLVETGSLYSGLFSTGGSVEFTPSLNSGFSTIGGRIGFSFSLIGVFVDNVHLYSGFSTTGGSIEFTPPLNSGLSRTGGRIVFCSSQQNDNPLLLLLELVIQKFFQLSFLKVQYFHQFQFQI